MAGDRVGELDLGQQAGAGVGRQPRAECLDLATRRRHVGVAARARLQQRQHQMALAGAGVGLQVDQFIGIGGDRAQHACLFGGEQAVVLGRVRRLFVIAGVFVIAFGQ
ncbi:hypothetical protein D3C72_1259560 [compost metagenome]